MDGFEVFNDQFVILMHLFFCTSISDSLFSLSDLIYALLATIYIV